MNSLQTFSLSHQKKIRNPTQRRGNSIFQSSGKFHVAGQQLSELHTTDGYDLKGPLPLPFVSDVSDTWVPFCLNSGLWMQLITFLTGVKGPAAAAPTLQPPIAQNAEQHFDGGEFNRSRFKDSADGDRERASVNVIGSTSNPPFTREVRTKRTR